MAADSGGVQRMLDRGTRQPQWRPSFGRRNGTKNGGRGTAVRKTAMQKNGGKRNGGKGTAAKRSSPQGSKK